MDIFWKTIGEYNTSTWPIQILLVLLGTFLTIKLYKEQSKRMVIAMKLFMIVLNLWIAIAYYSVYCKERQYYYIFSIFWGMVACIWIYDLIAGKYRFERSFKYDKIAYALFFIPFVYPLVSLRRGMMFPEMTSPIMPCTITIYTIAILMSFSKKINIFLVLFLFHWAWLGISKIYLYKIPEDILLTICTIPAVFLYFKEYIGEQANTETKPSIRAINRLLLISCCVIGVVFTFIIIKGYAQAA